MGNLNEIINHISSKNEKSNLPHKLYSKIFTKSNRKICQKDQFIIEYSQKHVQSNSVQIENIDNRRVVIISLLGLYLTWKKMPSHILYSCLIILPLKQQWLYYPQQYKMEIESSFLSDFNYFTDVELIELFELLKWKDKQGYVYFALDNYKCASNSLIHPFWHHLSEHISTLYDPITGTKYNKLSLCDKYWKNKKHFVYDVNKLSVITELYYLTMRFKAVKEILCDSNDSLHIIKGYGNDYYTCTNKRYELFDAFDNDENVEDWFISNDYNPNDL